MAVMWFMAPGGDRLTSVIEEVGGLTPTVDGVVIINPLLWQSSTKFWRGDSTAASKNSSQLRANPPFVRSAGRSCRSILSTPEERTFSSRDGTATGNSFQHPVS